jgi:branched-chain amino acid transport system permease protein
MMKALIKLSQRDVIHYIVLFLILGIIPLFIKNPYLLHVLIMLYFLTYLGGGWNILGGYTGQFSLGHATFFGIGAYASTLLYLYWGIPPWVGMLIGGVISMLVGIFVGFLCFRYGVRGVYFVLITLCFNEIVRLIFINWKMSGGPSGILIPLKGNSFLNFQFTDKIPYYYIMLLMTILMILTTWRIEKNWLGDYMIAIREDEDASEALGIDTTRYKLIPMAISCFAMALGGTFYAQYMLYIQPDITIGIPLSIQIIFGPIVGGMGTIWGPLIGATILTAFSEISRVTIGQYRGMHLMVYGVFIILIMLYMPHGLLTGLKGLYGKIFGEKKVFWET